jgi:hypothetical protein
MRKAWHRESEERDWEGRKGSPRITNSNHAYLVKKLGRRLQEVLFGSKPVPLELFSSMPMSYDQRKNHLRWRATELRFYGSEEAVLRVRLPERWTPIWALTKRGYTPEPVTS